VEVQDAAPSLARALHQAMLPFPTRARAAEARGAVAAGEEGPRPEGSESESEEEVFFVPLAAARGPVGAGGIDFGNMFGPSQAAKTKRANAKRKAEARATQVGFGRIVAFYHRSSTSYSLTYRCLYF
jgi:hypothetical protein